MRLGHFTFVHKSFSSEISFEMIILFQCQRFKSKIYGMVATEIRVAMFFLIHSTLLLSNT